MNHFSELNVKTRRQIKIVYCLRAENNKCQQHKRTNMADSEKILFDSVAIFNILEQ